MNHGAHGYRSLGLRDLLLGTHRFDSLRSDGAFEPGYCLTRSVRFDNSLLLTPEIFYGRTRWLDSHEDLLDASIGVELDYQDEKFNISERLVYNSQRRIM